MKKVIFITVLTIIFVVLPELVLAKDVIASLAATETKATQIMMRLGPLALLAAAAAFQFSRQMGMTLLVGSCIGIVIFAGHRGIFDLIYRAFN